MRARALREAADPAKRVEQEQRVQRMIVNGWRRSKGCVGSPVRRMARPTQANTGQTETIPKSPRARLKTG